MVKMHEIHINSDVRLSQSPNKKWHWSLLNERPAHDGVSVYFPTSKLVTRQLGTRSLHKVLLYIMGFTAWTGRQTGNVNCYAIKDVNKLRQLREQPHLF